MFVNDEVMNANTEFASVRVKLGGGGAGDGENEIKNGVLRRRKRDACMSSSTNCLRGDASFDVVKYEGVFVEVSSVGAGFLATVGRKFTTLAEKSTPGGIKGKVWVDMAHQTYPNYRPQQVR